jgi:hypothetical protein
MRFSHKTEAIDMQMKQKIDNIGSTLEFNIRMPK